MKMFKAEWKKVFTNKKLMMMMGGILFVPIIYAGIILSAYWDPFGNTSNLPVAVVNLDESSSFEDQTLRVGDELIGNLKENNDLDWHFVDEDVAKKGYEAGDYYMIITIPNDFSEKASTVLSDHPEEMSLKYTVDPGRNFFSVTISEQAMKTINEDISASVTKEYTKAIFAQLEQIGEGFAEARDAAEEIEKGAEDLTEGNGEITSHLNSMSSNMLSFKSGTEDVQKGLESFNRGINDLNRGAVDLNAGIVDYTNAVHQLEEAVAPLSNVKNNGDPLGDGLKNLLAGSQQLNDGLVALNNEVPTNGEVDQLIQGLSDVQRGVNELQGVIAEIDAPPILSEQVNTLNNSVEVLQPQVIGALGGYKSINQAVAGDSGLIAGSSQLTKGLDQAIQGNKEIVAVSNQMTSHLPQLIAAIDSLSAHSEDLRSGSASLVNGTEVMSNEFPSLADGTAQLNQGATMLNKGIEDLATGSSALGDGMASLDEGVGELAFELSKGAESVDNIAVGDSNFDMIASPTSLEENESSTVKNYGHALAPMFISLGLYIGALAFNLVFPLSEPSVKPTSGFSWWFSKFSLGFVVSVGASLILTVILLFGMNLEVASVSQFTLITILGSMTYMFFMMLLVITLDNPGRFIAMILLVLQLASSGGMFPAILQNSFFQAINPYMPMTYVIYGLRESMTSSLGSGVFNLSIIALLGCIILFNILIWLYFHVINKKKVAVALQN
ncbi:MAG TPA: YhgE/Pip domain-containing protein [Bacillota bacterium]|nr:YhgE/Pip domain-containing protein [Bacillota bacterium]